MTDVKQNVDVKTFGDFDLSSSFLSRSNPLSSVTSYSVRKDGRIRFGYLDQDTGIFTQIVLDPHHRTDIKNIYEPPNYTYNCQVFISNINNGIQFINDLPSNCFSEDIVVDIHAYMFVNDPETYKKFMTMVLNKSRIQQLIEEAKNNTLIQNHGNYVGGLAVNMQKLDINGNYVVEPYLNPSISQIIDKEYKQKVTENKNLRHIDNNSMSPNSRILEINLKLNEIYMKAKTIQEYIVKLLDDGMPPVSSKNYSDYVRSCYYQNELQSEIMRLINERSMLINIAYQANMDNQDTRNNTM